MTEIRFYHLTRGYLEDALPVMLELTVGRDRRRAVVMAGSPARIEVLNRHLWVYNDRGFLAHGSREDGNAADQPIWLTDQEENPNGAKVLFLTDGAGAENIAGFELVCEIFDGNDEKAVAAARGRWQSYKDAGHQLAYFQQNSRGGWQKKSRPDRVIPNLGRLCSPSEGVEKSCRYTASPATFLLPDGRHKRSTRVIINETWYKR